MDSHKMLSEIILWRWHRWVQMCMGGSSMDSHDFPLVKGHVVSAEQPSFVGKLQYADAQIFGRAGRIALHDLQNLGHVSRAPVSLSPQSVAAVEKLRKRILHSRPRTLKATWRDPPVVIFTDGALQEASELGSETTIGGVLFPPDNQSKVAPMCQQRWRRDGAHHVIGITELHAMVTALLFVDNWSALDTCREFLLVLEDPSELAMTCVWAARVPSNSNISDGPSRACLKELGQFSPQVVHPLCPITGHMLRSLV